MKTFFKINELNYVNTKSVIFIKFIGKHFLKQEHYKIINKDTIKSSLTKMATASIRATMDSQQGTRKKHVLNLFKVSVRCLSAFIVNSKQISHIVLVFSFLTLNQ